MIGVGKATHTHTGQQKGEQKNGWSTQANRTVNSEKKNFGVFHPIWLKFGMGVILAQNQRKMSLKCLQPFFYLPDRPIKSDQ